MILASALLSAALLVTLLCLRIYPAAVDWRRLRTPIVVAASTPVPSPIGFGEAIERTWHSTETYRYYRTTESRTGVSDADPIGPPVEQAWTTEPFNVGIHGASKSSPSVDASGVYVGSDAGWIRAYDHDGQLRWKFKSGNSVRGIHSTPILTRDRVYLGNYGGSFYVLDKKDGSLVWTFRIDGTAFGSSPLIVDDRLYAVIETETRNAFVVAMDAKRGTVLWRSPFLGEQSHASPTYDRQTQTLLLGANNKTFFSLDARDGRVVWRRYLGGEIKGTALVAEGIAYVTSWAGKLHALDVVTGKLRWEAALGGPSQSSPTLMPGTDVLVVGVSSGTVLGLDRRNGRHLWQIDGGEPILSSALATRDERGEWWAWIACGRAELCAIAPRTGKVTQRLPLTARLTGVPVAFEHSLYLSLNFPGGLTKLTRIKR